MIITRTIYAPWEAIQNWDGIKPLRGATRCPKVAREKGLFKVVASLEVQEKMGE